MPFPKRIFLVRHGQSEGNVNEKAYHNIPDWKIKLTDEGEREAFELGKKIKNIIENEPVYIYYSPYLRTRQTLKKMLESLKSNDFYGIQEEPRITEQQFGNFQNSAMPDYKQQKRLFGNFYYRYPNGGCLQSSYLVYWLSISIMVFS